MAESIVELCDQFLADIAECGRLVGQDVTRNLGFDELRGEIELFAGEGNDFWLEELTRDLVNLAQVMERRVREVVLNVQLDEYMSVETTNSHSETSTPAGEPASFRVKISSAAQRFAAIATGSQEQIRTAHQLLTEASRHLEMTFASDPYKAVQSKVQQIWTRRKLSRESTFMGRLRSRSPQRNQARRLSEAIGDAQLTIDYDFQRQVIEQALNLLEGSSEEGFTSMSGSRSTSAVRIFRLGQSSIKVFMGSITDSDADIVVSSDDNLLTMGGGVSRAIQLAAGLEIIQDAGKMTPRALGDVVVTTAGRMPNRYVIHAVTMMASGGFLDLPRGLMIRQLCHKIMALLPQLNCRSVAFPALGAGVAGIPYEDVAAEMGEAVLDAVLLSEDSVDVELYLTDRFGGNGVDRFLAIFESTALARFGLDSRAESSNGREVNLTDLIGTGSTAARQTDNRMAQVIETLRDLDAQRSRIEAQILELTNSEAAHDSDNVWVLTSRLEALAELRRMYESELTTAPGAVSAHEGGVFVSSTSKDLREHRTAVRDVVTRLNLRFIGMEEFEANSLAPADLIRQKVIESSIYVGILGMRYGFVDQASGLSMTELEYRQAVAGDKDIRMFVMDEDAPVKASMVERDPHQLGLLNDFRERVLTSHVCNLFETANDLADKVANTLATIR